MTAEFGLSAPADRRAPDAEPSSFSYRLWRKFCGASRSLTAAVLAVALGVSACSTSPPSEASAPSAAADSDMRKGRSAGEEGAPEGVGPARENAQGVGGDQLSMGDSRSGDDLGDTQIPGEAKDKGVWHNAMPAREGEYPVKLSGFRRVVDQSEDYPEWGVLSVTDHRAANAQDHDWFFGTADTLTISYLFNQGRIYVIATTQRHYGMEVQCRFEQPVPLHIGPGSADSNDEGIGECDGTAVTLKVLRKGSGSRVLDSVTYETSIVEHMIRIESEDMLSEATRIEEFVPSLGLSVYSDTHAHGAYTGIPFEWRLTAELISAVPQP